MQQFLELDCNGQTIISGSGSLPELNRPGFSGERKRLTECIGAGQRMIPRLRGRPCAFVEHSRGIFKAVPLFMERGCRLARRTIADGAVQQLPVAPVDPFVGFPFDLATGVPRAEKVGDLH